MCQLTVLWWSLCTSALGDPGDVLVCESPLPPESPRIPCCFLAKCGSFKCQKNSHVHLSSLTEDRDHKYPESNLGIKGICKSQQCHTAVKRRPCRGSVCSVCRLLAPTPGESEGLATPTLSLWVVVWCVCLGMCALADQMTALGVLVWLIRHLERVSH